MLRNFKAKILLLTILFVLILILSFYSQLFNGRKFASSIDINNDEWIKNYHSHLKPKNVTSKRAKYTLDQFHFEKLLKDRTARVKNRKPFKPIVTLAERKIMYQLLEFFDKVTTANNIPYFLYSGTLLGSFRHHDIIPWDDDLDVIVPYKDRYKLHYYIEKYQPKFVLVNAVGRDKIFSSNSPSRNPYWWRWPFLDISYYKENATFIWDTVIAYGKYAYHPKSLIFPLKRRPMYNLYLNAPRDSYATLLWIFSFTENCQMSYYSHIMESLIKSIKGIPCRELKDKFPFVDRYPHKDGVLEVLTFRGTNITSYVVPEPHYAVTEKFSLKLKKGFSIPKSVLLPKVSFYKP